jgi:hypothetical protein
MYDNVTFCNVRQYFIFEFCEWSENSLDGKASHGNFPKKAEYPGANFRIDVPYLRSKWLTLSCDVPVIVVRPSHKFAYADKLYLKPSIKFRQNQLNGSLVVRG